MRSFAHSPACPWFLPRPPLAAVVGVSSAQRSGACKMGTKLIRRSLAIPCSSQACCPDRLPRSGLSIRRLESRTSPMASRISPPRRHARPTANRTFPGIWAPRRQALKVEQGTVNIPPQMVNIADGMEGGLPYQPWARALAETRQADKSKDAPSEPLPAARTAARAHVSGPAKDRSNTRVARASERARLLVSTDLHRRPAAA